MKGKYFTDTNALNILLSDDEPAEISESIENVLLDLGEDGKFVGLTIEHVTERSGKMDFAYETTAA